MPSACLHIKPTTRDYLATNQTFFHRPALSSAPVRGATYRKEPKMTTNEWIKTLLASDLTKTQKLVGLVMAHHADWKTGTNIWASHATIATEATLSRDAVLNAIKALVATGFVSLRKTRPGTTNTYDLSLPSRAERQAPVNSDGGDAVADDGGAVVDDTNTPYNAPLTTPSYPPNRESNQTGIIRGLGPLRDAMASLPHIPSPGAGAGALEDDVHITSIKAPSQDLRSAAPDAWGDWAETLDVEQGLADFAAARGRRRFADFCTKYYQGVILREAKIIYGSERRRAEREGKGQGGP